MADTIGRRNRYANPGRPARIGFAVIAGFVLLLGTWSVAAPLSGAVIASGALQVEGRRQHVQHPYGGVVRKITVREAQQVTRGDILVILSDTQARAKYDVLKQHQLALNAQIAQKTRNGRGQQRIGHTRSIQRSSSSGSICAISWMSCVPCPC